MRVWQVTLYRELPSGCDVCIDMGVFSTRERARAAAKVVRDRPDVKSGTWRVYVGDTEVDRDGWCGGFVDATF